MILSTDLRLKNWVLYNSKAYQIDTISPELPILDADFGVGVVDYNNIYGIELTPEILEKCGFESNPYQDRYELGDIHVEHCAIRNLLWIDKHPHIKHLHQLQNFVYINTNTELPIEL